MRYNKIPRLLWQEGPLVALGAPPCCPSSLYLYLLTCDRPSCVTGLLNCGPGTIADHTGWNLHGIRLALAALVEARLVVASAKPALVWVPFAAQCDSPEGPKQKAGWMAALAEFPDAEPVRAAMVWLNGYLIGGASDTLSEGHGIPHRLQDQDQDQEQDQKNTETGHPAAVAASVRLSDPETEQPPTSPPQTPPEPEPEPQPVASPSRQPKPDVAAAIARVWDRYRTLQADKAGVRRGEKPTKDVADGLRARLQEHGEDAVLAVVEWSHRSKHSRAVFLRDGKLLGTTLFRPKNFAEYLTFAQSAKAPPEKSADPLPYTRNISPTYSLPDDEWRDLTDAERAAVWRRHLEEEARVEAKRKVSAEEERKWAEALTPEKREEYEKQKRRIEERKAADAAANPMRRMTV